MFQSARRTSARRDCGQGFRLCRKALSAPLREAVSFVARSGLLKRQRTTADYIQ